MPNLDLLDQESKRLAHSESIRTHYDAFAAERADWIAKNRWFYRRDLKNLQTIIPDGTRILEIGCGNGDLLEKLKPSFGVGVDISPRMIQIARERHPDLEFVEGNVEETDWFDAVKGPFDYILLSDVVGHPFDIQRALEQLQRLMSRETKLVITFFNRWWELAARLYIAVGFGMPRPRQNWLSRTDLYNVLTLTRYEVVSFQQRELSPRRMFGIGSLLNRAIAPIPPINWLCWRVYLVARSLTPSPPGQCSVTVLVPCRNERGNIEPCVRRLPEIGSHTEILFVEGGSSDGTYEECLRVQEAFPHRDIRVLKQTGKGKGDAVRLGFTEARGDIVMILDSDLTVPPEYMPRVYAALAEGQAEFVNCTRLVYPMEPGAMRTLNYLANRLFARVLSYLLNQSLSDTLCGTKALFKRDYLTIEADRQRLGSLDPFGDFDLILGAARRNMRIVEIPVRYEARTYGETQIQRFSDGVRLFRMVWQTFRRLKTR
jgi:ubiquinone/menaquinone biosynthesis C-methylase UbiE